MILNVQYVVILSRHLKKKVSMRKSKQNDLILEIINNSYNHPNAYMIYEECRKKIPNISLGTVYRNLNNLVNNMKIKRIKMPDNIDRYDRVNNFHSHFMCLKCMEIYDLDFKDNFFHDNLNGNKVLDYEISFKGICKNCLDNKEGGK